MAPAGVFRVTRDCPSGALPIRREPTQRGTMTKVTPEDRPNLSLDGLHTGTRRSFMAMLAVLIGPAASAQDDAEGRDKSALRRETMRRLATEMKVCEITDRKPGPPLPLRPEPL